jgi:hypothetical protein
MSCTTNICTESGLSFKQIFSNIFNVYRVLSKKYKRTQNFTSLLPFHEAAQYIRLCLLLAPLTALEVRAGFSYMPAGAIHLKENSYVSEQESNH